MLIQAINCIVTSPSVWNFEIQETSINLPVVIYHKIEVNKFMIRKTDLLIGVQIYWRVATSPTFMTEMTKLTLSAVLSEYAPKAP